MIVRPKVGLNVRHPVTRRHIPVEGLEVNDFDTYWTRRLRCGDVVLVEAQTEEKAKEPKE